MNGHDYVYLGDGETRCANCDCRPGGRVAGKPCGYHECYMASRVDVGCQNEGHNEILISKPEWRMTVIVHACSVHLQEELDRQAARADKPTVTTEWNGPEPTYNNEVV